MHSRNGRARKTYNQAEKASIIAAFDVIRREGASGPTAAANLGVPVANIFRWKASNRKAELQTKFERRQLLVSGALLTLYKGPNLHQELYFEALFILIS